MDSEINSEWQKDNNHKRLFTNQTVMLNLFQHLFRIGFRNLLELLFHLPLIKQYLIVLFGRVQSLILFALQILFAMLRAISSFGLRPHSTQNSQVWNDSFLYGFVIAKTYFSLWRMCILYIHILALHDKNIYKTCCIMITKL